MEKDKRRATRRSREAKALQQKQFRHRVIRNKKREFRDEQESIAEILLREQREMQEETQDMGGEEQRNYLDKAKGDEETT